MSLTLRPDWGILSRVDQRPMFSLTGISTEYVQRRVLTGSIRPLTARGERHVLRGFAKAMGQRPLNQVGRHDVERWLGAMNHLSPGTRRNRFSIVSSFFQWCVHERRITHNPCDGIRAPKVPRSRHRALAAAQCAALLMACPDARAVCVVMLGLQLGLRRAEIAGLEVGDIDWTAKVVEVTGKGGHVRIVPLTVEARHAISAYLAESPANGGPLIRGDRHPTAPVAPVWIGRLVTRLAYEAGIKLKPRDGVSTHALRHTAGSDVYLSSRDVLAVRDLLGHSNLSATQVYVRGLDVERLRQVIEGRKYRP